MHGAAWEHWLLKTRAETALPSHKRQPCSSPDTPSQTPGGGPVTGLQGKQSDKGLPGSKP